MKNLSPLLCPSSCRGTLSLLLTVALAGVCTSASAAFFQLAENNASGIGNAFAGGAAIAEDASTVWYNPAGMTRLTGQQFVAAGHFIKPSFEFNKTSANTVLGGAIRGGNGGDAGENALVPNLYYTQQLNDRLFVGLGFNAPFGLATEYESGWVGRYHAVRSEIKTVNLNGALAFKVNDQFSIGGGVNYQKLEAALTQAIDFATICTTSGGSALCGAAAGFNSNNPNDGFANVEADDDAWGYNFGVLWQLTDATRLGLAYRSQMKFKLEGSIDVTGGTNTAVIQTGGGIVDSGVKANVTIPPTLGLSVYQQLAPQWVLMGDITRTFWSKLSELRIDFDSTQADSVVTLNLEDVNRYSVGASFIPGGAWTYRMGVALDQSPTTSAADRTPRLPDADRLWITFGAGYKPSKSLTFDFGLVFIQIDDSNVNKTATGENAARGSLVGNYEGSTQILSAQANWKF